MLGPSIYGFFLLRGVYAFLIGGQRETPQLPEDIIIFHILTWLPAEKLLELKSVCKSWYHKIGTPSFAYIHLGKTKQGLLRSFERGFTKPPFYRTNLVKKIRYNNIMVRDFSADTRYAWCSCNGLLLCRTVLDCRPPVIVNPVTKRLVQLPPSPSDGKYSTFDHLFGLTFVSGKYKVIHVFISNRNKKLLGCEILTIGEDKWKLVHISCTSVQPQFCVREILFIQDVAHWIVLEKDETQIAVRGSKIFVVSWDFINEKLHKTGYSCSHEAQTPLKIRGFLSFVTRVKGCRSRFEIWSLKDFSSGNWVKEQTIELEGVNQDVVAITSLEDGRVIIFRSFNPNFFYAYDAQLKQTTYLNFDEFPECIYDSALAHMDSLVSCKNLWQIRLK